MKVADRRAQPRLSVVIPTFNRRRRLAETLDALEVEAHSGPPLQVVVVDDGSTDDTRELLAALRPSAFELRVLHQENLGPATARNRGVDVAEAPFVWFLGDDTRPIPGSARLHLQALEKGVGAQGRIDWDPAQEITPLMRFLAPEGPQFYFRGLVDGEALPFSAVLGSNLSAPAEWLRREPFDEGFPHAAVEDTEMAWRWRRHGWQVIFLARAVCLHHHRYDDLDTFLARQRRAGRSARHAVRRHRALGWKLLLEPALVGLYKRLRQGRRQATQEESWDEACRRAYLRGFFSSRT